jgi:ankyrin repeat protein
MPIHGPLTPRLAAIGLALLPVFTSAADIEAYRKALAADDRQLLVAMLRADAGRTPTGPSGGSLLHLACSYLYTKQQAAMVAALIAAGASLEARDMYGGTPLNWAAGSDCLDCVHLLLKAGAQPMARNNRGATPLHVSGPRVAAALIAAGADPLAVDLQGNRPLHRQYHDAFLVAGISVRNHQGFTPLHMAALSGDDEGARWLLARGADPAAQSTAPYEHRDGLGPEWGSDPVHLIDKGARPYDIALWQHDRSKWSTGRYRKTLELLDAATPRRSWLAR